MLPLTLLRHTINQGVNCVKVNNNLLYHRQITLLHLFISRIALEVIGTSFAFIVVVAVLNLLGLEDLPRSMPIIYVGWFLLAWIVFGMTLIFGSIAALSEIFERAVNLLTYVDDSTIWRVLHDRLATLPISRDGRENSSCRLRGDDPERLF